MGPCDVVWPGIDLAGSAHNLCFFLRTGVTRGRQVGAGWAAGRPGSRWEVVAWLKVSPEAALLSSRDVQTPGRGGPWLSGPRADCSEMVSPLPPSHTVVACSGPHRPYVPWTTVGVSALAADAPSRRVLYLVGQVKVAVPCSMRSWLRLLLPECEGWVPASDV